MSESRKRVKPFLFLISLILLGGLGFDPAPQQGTVTIIKVASIKSSQTFQFASTLPNMKSFNLIDDGTGTGNRMTVRAAPGVYGVAEINLESWVLERVVCDNGDAAQSIQLGPGEAVECTFYNLFEIVEPPIYFNFLPITAR